MEVSFAGEIIEAFKPWSVVGGSPVMFGGQKSSEVFCKPSFKPVCLEIPINLHMFWHFVDEILVFWLVKTYYSQAT